MRIVPRPRQVVGRAGQAGNRQIVGALDHGHNQTPIERHGHAEIDVAFVDDLIAAHLRVEDGKFAQPICDRLKDERHVC